jgi:hypothetical protein
LLCKRVLKHDNMDEVQEQKALEQVSGGSVDALGLSRSAFPPDSRAMLRALDPAAGLADLRSCFSCSASF